MNTIHKDEYFIGYATRYIVLPSKYAVWDTQTQCWVGDFEKTDKDHVRELADKYNQCENHNDVATR